MVFVYIVQTFKGFVEKKGTVLPTILNFYRDWVSVEKIATFSIFLKIYLQSCTTTLAF